MKRVFVAAVALVAAAALILLVLRFQSGPPRYVRAVAFLGTVSLAAVIGLALVMAAYLVRFTRPILLRLVPTDTVGLVCSFGVGLVLGTPTLIWRFQAFLQSVEAYRTSYLDYPRAAWPL